MTIINRNQLSAACQPSEPQRAVLTLIVDNSLQKHGLNFPVALIPFVREELPSTLHSTAALSNVCYTLESNEATFESLEQLLAEIGISHNVVNMQEVGGNENETFYHIKLNILENLVAA